jgi:hypothetical protein
MTAMLWALHASLKRDGLKLACFPECCAGRSCSDLLLLELQKCSPSLKGALRCKVRYDAGDFCPRRAAQACD